MKQATIHSTWLSCCLMNCSCHFELEEKNLHMKKYQDE